ncbi:MAG TPA: antibiotic biosynthesis monooxygenase [Actinomycetota bacterium]|nr:antibiotic biosynthesis monooxygenase [Actinomycetota bacterium]
MYGTVARMKVKPGELELLQKTMQDWDAQGGTVEGAVATYVYKLDSDPNEIIMVALFQDKKTYLANADDPKTDEWFQLMRAHLEADPEWNDGEVVISQQY